MHTQIEKPPVRQQQAHEPQRPTNSQPRHVDKRPAAQRMAALQRLAATCVRPQDQKIAQLKALADTHTHAQRFPIQRQPTDLKAQMGAQHGVDLSGVKEIPNSSFPRSVGALATIQGNRIDYAPSQFTTANRKHELGHAIDNAKNGTPKGDTIVNGQNVDTTRERAAQKIADTPLQRIQEGGFQPSEKPKVQVLQTLADVSHAKTPIQTTPDDDYYDYWAQRGADEDLEELRVESNQEVEEDDPQREKKYDGGRWKQEESGKWERYNNTTDTREDFKKEKQVETLNPKKKDKDKNELFRRIGRLDAPGLKELAEAYVEEAHKETDRQTQKVDDLITYLQKMKGFRLPYYWYVKNQKEKNFSTLKEDAKFHTRGRLWSKMNSTISKKLAGDESTLAGEQLEEKEKGILLESSVSGFIFDGLNFGLDRENDLSQYLWKELSANYVAGLTGTVNVDMLEGWDEGSVFYTTELPKLMEMMEKDNTLTIDINRYAFTSDDTIKLMNQVKGIKNQDDLKTREKNGEDVLPSLAALKEANPQLKDKQAFLDKNQRLYGEFLNKIEERKGKRQQEEKAKKVIIINKKKSNQKVGRSIVLDKENRRIVKDRMR